MNTEFRLILLIAGFILVAYVLIDGFRRLKTKNKSKKKAPQKSLETVVEDQEEVIDSNAEFGLGTVRKVRSEHHLREPVVDEDASIESLNAINLSDDDLRSDELESVSAVVAEPELVISLNVMARNTAFSGSKLLEVLIAEGLRFGEMDLFHRHVHASGKGPKLFSMANAFNPGTFDINSMSDFSTNGLTFFLILPGPPAPREAFRLMIKTARSIAEALDGKLLDGSRSVLTQQTIHHYHDQIVEFERKRLANEKLVTS